jgi:broad specificity phosphatase PhoE
MEIYFVRHGQTSGNVARRHQANDTPLSPRGKKQAELAANVLKVYQPDHLVTSTMVRSVETASVIGAACNLIPDTRTEFRELERPSYLYGRKHRSFMSMWFYFRWYLGKTTEGESYEELRIRFRDAQEILASLKPDARVVVVSHTVFITLFIAHLCRDKALTPFHAAKAFYKIITMRNTHIEMLLYDPATKQGTCGWIVEKDA